MPKPQPEAKIVSDWLKDHDSTPAELQRQIGDDAEQTRHWLAGDRTTLPLGLKALIAQETGLPLRSLLTKRERDTARTVVHVAARDATA